MSAARRHGLLAILLAGAGAFWIASARQGDAPDALAARRASLEQAIARLEDENAIENLQRAYGYYTDKKLWSQVADLFARQGRVEFSQRGVVIGRERIRAFLRVFGAEGLQRGSLANHLQLQPVIHVAPDGRTAQGRWRALQMNGTFGQSANWGGGIYENDYVKEDGVWKIASLRVYNTFYVDYDPGWIDRAYPHAGVREGFAPDLPPSEPYGIYPEVHVAPFHYPNPVTGE